MRGLNPSRIALDKIIEQYRGIRKLKSLIELVNQFHMNSNIYAYKYYVDISA